MRNRDLGLLQDDKASAIIQAADEVLEGGIMKNLYCLSGKPARAPRAI